MGELVKSYNFDADGGGFTFTTGGKSTGVWQSTGGNTGGCWNIDTLGRNNTDDCYIELITTWESLGVPTGATINSITASSYDWRCSVANVTNLYGVGALEVHDNTPTLQATLSTELNGTVTTSYASKTGGTVSIPSAIQASGTTVRIRLNFHLDNANDKNAQTQVLIDNLSLTVDYTPSGQEYTLNLNDSVNISDANSFINTFQKTLSDTVNISDESSFTSAFQRTISDVVNISEQIDTGVVLFYLTTQNGYLIAYNGYLIKMKE